jgi:hypothetical protein
MAGLAAIEIAQKVSEGLALSKESKEHHKVN